MFVHQEKCPRKIHFKTQCAVASAGEPEMSLPDLVNDQVASCILCTALRAMMGEH